MLIVRVELHSATDGSVTEIARAHIANDGSGTEHLGNYTAVAFSGRSKETLDKLTIAKNGTVRGYPRLRHHPFVLVRKALQAMGY
jgi:hypothetical protein